MARAAAEALIPSVAQLRVVPEGGGWRVTVGDGVSRVAEGTVPAQALEPLRTSPAAPVARILVAGSDAAFTRSEDLLGAALATALSAAGEAWSHLQVLRGRAEAHGEPLTVVVDAEHPAVRDLPWELLSLGDGPLESTQGGAVVRLASGGHGVCARQPTASVWVGADDPVSVALAAGIRQGLAAAAIPEVSLDDGPGLIWIVAHGAPALDAIEVALDTGPASSSAVSARLGDALRTSACVVVAVCHGVASGPARSDVVAGRVLAAGAPMVLAPSDAVPTEAVIRLTRGLCGAIARGVSLGRAVVAGRREVRAWAFPHPLARWWRIPCLVSSVQALQLVLRPASWAPPGWPTPDAEAARWLDEARRDAIRRQDGYVGVDHLVRALATLDGGGPIAAAVRRGAPRILREYEHASGLVPQFTDDPPPVATPRLVGWSGILDRGFGVDALAGLLVEQMEVGASDVGGETLSRTEDRAEGPATALEVLGGPEDGRILVLAEGGVVGRSGGGADRVLYADTRLTDRRLSRRHLRWTGPGAVWLEREGEARRVQIGDVLPLTAATHLRGIRHLSPEG